MTKGSREGRGREKMRLREKERREREREKERERESERERLMMHSHYMIYPGSVWVVNKSQNSSIRPAPYILHYMYTSGYMQDLILLVLSTSTKMA